MGPRRQEGDVGCKRGWWVSLDKCPLSSAREGCLSWQSVAVDVAELANPLPDYSEEPSAAPAAAASSSSRVEDVHLVPLGAAEAARWQAAAESMWAALSAEDPEGDDRASPGAGR